MRFVALLLALLPFDVQAQTAATLIADSVTVTADEKLTAQGNIEALYDGTRLSAQAIVYDRATDRLQITGPILIQTPDGTILTADSADLDPRLENGLLQGARLVLDQQLQLAANRIDRVGGRFAQLTQAAATSCQVCGNQTPLWDIRASRVVHDQVEQQLYFDNATLRIRGVPVFWVPQMRLPDPTLKRATGFLIPVLRTTSQLGTGIKTPYFVRFGNHRDLTLTPYLSSETTTLEAIYRQAFLNGDIKIQAAGSRDTLTDGTRSYIFAEGDFDLGGDYQLVFDVESTSDDAYLLDYGYSSKDRLDSAIRLLRVGNNDLFSARLTYFETLRDDESNRTLPPLVADFGYSHRIDGIGGGALTFRITGDGLLRTEKGSGALSRDVVRIGIATSWQRDWVLPMGVLFNADTGLRADWYRVNDDPDFSESDIRSIPHATATLRWPLMKTTNRGVTHLIEPAMSLAWSRSYGGTPPNEDSTRAELDQANLLALTRFPGDDRQAEGLRGALGLTWTRDSGTMDSGTLSSLTFGRVLRQDSVTDFSASSGLDGKASDWLLAGQIDTQTGVRVEGRTLFDDDFVITRGAAKVGWVSQSLDLSAAYIWQAADAAEDRPLDVSEWSFDTRVQINDTWAVSADARYDIAADSPARAGIGLEWQNECVAVDLSVSRRYTSSTTVDSSTDYGLSVTLNGFSAGRAAGGPAASCKN